MLSSLMLTAALQQQSVSQAFSAQPAVHQVVTGDTLSGIAAAAGVSLVAVEAANPQIANPNLIYTGQRVNLPSGSGTSSASPGRDGDGDFDHDSSDAPTASPAPPSPSALPVSAAPGSFQQCVITRESGGNPHAVNSSSGAGGLYQFLPSTWASLGYSGLPENASVALQNQAFQRLFALDGVQPWQPSDGCTL